MSACNHDSETCMQKRACFSNMSHPNGETRQTPCVNGVLQGGVCDMCISRDTVSVYSLEM